MRTIVRISGVPWVNGRRLIGLGHPDRPSASPTDFGADHIRHPHTSPFRNVLLTAGGRRRAPREATRHGRSVPQRGRRLGPARCKLRFVIVPAALQMVLCVLTGWLDRREREAVAYLIEENRLLRRQLGTRRAPLPARGRRVCRALSSGTESRAA